MNIEEKLVEKMSGNFHSKLLKELNIYFKRNEFCSCGKKTKNRQKALKLLLKANKIFLKEINKCLVLKKYV